MVGITQHALKGCPTVQTSDDPNNLYSIKVIARGFRGAELLRFLTSHYLLPFQFAILFLIP